MTLLTDLQGIERSRLAALGRLAQPNRTQQPCPATTVDTIAVAQGQGDCWKLSQMLATCDSCPDSSGKMCKNLATLWASLLDCSPATP